MQNLREKYINLELRNEEPNENVERMNERKEERTHGRKNESEAYHRSLTLVDSLQKTLNFKILRLDLCRSLESGACFSDAPETFRARKDIFCSSVS